MISGLLCVTLVWWWGAQLHPLVLWGRSASLTVGTLTVRGSRSNAITSMLAVSHTFTD